MVSFGTREEAEAHRIALEKQAGGWTTGEAVTAYLDAMRERECAESSIERTRYAFAMLNEVKSVPVKEVNASRLRALYLKRAGVTKADTHHGELSTVKMLFAWCVEQGWLRSNPAETIKPKGKRSRGKKQLRIDDARKLIEKALELGDAGDDAGYAVALTLLTAARASEIARREVRDIDDDGHRLIVMRSKTRAGDRRVAIPEVMRSRLLKMIEGKDPAAPLWGEERTRYWLHYHVVRIAGLAAVGHVTPHGLRGTHSTVAVESDVAVEAVARSLGHSKPGVTRDHYIASGTEQDAKARAFLRVLTGGRS